MAKSEEQLEQERATARAEIAAQYVEVLFDDAFVIREDQTSLNDRRKANREELRNAAKAGRLTEEQAKLLEELYPVRTRSTDGDESETGEANPNGAGQE